MRAMSTPVGHSRLQPLHEMHSAIVSRMLVGDERLGPELARQCQPQCVGAAARQMLLVAGRAIGRAHDAGVAGAAGAVVVAHLGRRGEAAPFRPVERGVDRQRAVVRLEAEQAAVVHLRRPHDLAGVEETLPGRRRP